MRPNAVFAALLTLGWSAAGATSAEQSPRDLIRVTSLNDGRFHLVQGPARTVLDLNSSISGCTGPLYDSYEGKQYGGAVGARVLDEVRRAGFWYMVMQVSTQSRCNIQGQCGAASSVDVIWLKLDARLRPVARQAASVEDCNTDAGLSRFDGRRQEGDAPRLEMRGGVLSLESTGNDYTRKITTVTTLRYDRRAPQQGLVLTKRVGPLK